MSEIIERFEMICAEMKNTEAVIYRDRMNIKRKTFSELHDDVWKMAAYLSQCGVRQGDRILAFALSSYHLSVFMLAALHTGASIMYVDIFAKQASLQSVFEQYHPHFVLVSNQTKHLRWFFGSIRTVRKILNIDGFTDFQADEWMPRSIPEDQTALLTMTTGSTGIPKIVLRSHRDLMQQLQLIHRNITAGTNEIVLTTSYIYVFANILSGFTTVMPLLNLGRYSPKRINRILKLFRNERISMVITSPDFCLKAEPVFPQLRMLYFGGAILNRYEAEMIRKKFHDCRCHVIYGATECNLIAVADLDDMLEVLKTDHRALLGKPVDGVQVRLTDDGEILVASEALLENYVSDSDTSKILDENGILWHRTNDYAGYHGSFLYYKGKGGNSIDVNSVRIFSNIIEQEIIAQFPSIPKCAVFMKSESVYVVVQGRLKPSQKDGIETIMRSFGVTSWKLRMLRKIPCDVKHHTKINYQKLREKTW